MNTGPSETQKKQSITQAKSQNDVRGILLNGGIPSQVSIDKTKVQVPSPAADQAAEAYTKGASKKTPTGVRPQTVSRTAGGGSSKSAPRSSSMQSEKSSRHSSSRPGGERESSVVNNYYHMQQQQPGSSVASASSSREPYHHHHYGSTKVVNVRKADPSPSQLSNASSQRHYLPPNNYGGSNSSSHAQMTPSIL